MDIQLSCRACMKILPKNSTWLWNIGSMKNIFTSSNLQFDDLFLPKYLCENCYTTCIKWKDFVKQCEKSQNRFVEIIINKKNEERNIETVPIEDDPLNNLKEKNDIEMLKIPDPIHIIVKKTGTMGNEPSKEILKCKTCNSMFVDSEAYEKHYNTVHRKKSSKFTDSEIKIKKMFKCKECRQMFDDLDVYETHYNNLHKILCSICKTKFKSVPDCFEHQKNIHTVNVLPVLFNCTVCDMGFNTILHHKEHMRVHKLEEESNPIIFSCSICSKVLSNRQNLKIHFLVHDEAKTNCCEYCGKSFKTQKYLNHHILVAHKVLEAYLQCHLCRHKFKTQKRLDLHVKLHLAEKEIQCEFCPIMFKTQSTYKNHRMIHTGQKKYFCRICNHGFIQHHALKAHMKVH